MAKSFLFEYGQLVLVFYENTSSKDQRVVWQMNVLKPNNLEQSQGVWNSPIALNKANKLKIHDNNI